MSIVRPRPGTPMRVVTSARTSIGTTGIQQKGSMRLMIPEKPSAETLRSPTRAIETLTSTLRPAEEVYRRDSRDRPDAIDSASAR